MHALKDFASGDGLCRLSDLPEAGSELLRCKFVKKEATQFIFDLDGTITQEETLPLIAEHFGVTEEIKALTQQTVLGSIPFAESLAWRVRILGALPVDEVAHLLAQVQLHEGVMQFIHAHRDQCSIATGNLRPWIEKLVARLDCACDASEAVIENNRVAKLTHVLHKEDVVQRYQKNGTARRFYRGWQQRCRSHARSRHFDCFGADARSRARCAECGRWHRMG